MKGGIAVSEPAAGSMTAMANFAGSCQFDTLLDTYLEYCALEESERVEFLGEHRTYRPLLGVPPFGQGQVDMAAFATIYEIIHKLNHMLLVSHYFGPQEDLGSVYSQCIYH